MEIREEPQEWDWPQCKDNLTSLRGSLSDPTRFLACVQERVIPQLYLHQCFCHYKIQIEKWLY